MAYPINRHMFDASEAERVAYEIAHGARSAVRGLESQNTFGINIDEASAQAKHAVFAQDPPEIDDALAYLKRRKATREGLYSPANAGLEVSAAPDSQGEQQIGFDKAAWDAAQVAANEAGVVALGEEDEHRGEPGGGAISRGQRLKYLIGNDLPFAIVDPLDGSNQAAGMGQRSGWASCAMVKYPGSPQLAVAVLLGDGRGFVAHDDQVWMSESSHPDRTPLFYALNVDRSLSGLSRAHYVIPAAKRSTAERAVAIMRSDDSIEYISPLGGNPGILAAMYGASAPAALQPEAYAWDHMAALILANGGFPVIRATDTEPLSADDLVELLLTDLAAGRKTETLYMGRSLEAAIKLRDADRLARTFAVDS
ncbi:hypothetical protein [Microbacterium sp. No. 7]|uniref:hypothetical protein n=1 Tax=Microbacterium sp. No. 7 TaxID=1714373 RepID=UPI0006D022CA|nr:hypothetical protein [Microbacterium sp. No. 7]ALJ19028.1 hypothetical protein AOA12_03525 [Microbacterium sp. No. 7]